MKLLRNIKECQLSSWPSEHGKYMGGQLKYLWPPQQADHAIRSAVGYRISHPYIDIDLSKPENWNNDVDLTSDFVQGVITDQKKNQRYMERVIREYGKD